ncbi:synaptotagmin-15-like [Diaphorina citri]|uniref:Synaptotagmin-15-like n=1 Tax=Diaphorina citri TaxID=121845 RepID=A0A3Q0J4E7_DIACI|nr:synaptotagmin-15-like [Diaphorina citri]
MESKNTLTAAPGGNILNLPPVTVASVSSPDIVSDLMNEENEAREYMGGSNLTLRHEPDAYSLLSPFTCNWIKSQSMQTVVQGPSDGDLGQQEPEESEADKLARQHGLDPALYRVNVNLAKSTEAIDKAMKTMVDGSAPESQFIDLSYGSVQFTAVFDEAKKKLLVHVEKLESLAPKGKERSSYRCVMNFFLRGGLRLWRLMVRVQVINSAINVFRISVYDVAYQGVYDAIGHALFYLEDLSVEPHSMKLYQQATPDVNPGLVQLSLKYNCETEYLNVCVVKASCLNSIPTKSSVFLKVSQFYNNKKIKDQKYPSIPCDGEVEFNTNTEFRVPSNFSAKHNHVIAIRIKVKNSISKAGFTLGYVVLGPMYYAEDGFTLTPWGRALLKNETVSHTFRLVA